MSFTLSSLAFVLVSALHVFAESHTVRFQNNCGTGTPKLVQGGKILSTGEDYTSNGPINSAIAYLDRNDECLLNGEHCTLVEMNMNNPSCPGCGSSVDISLIPSHAFNVETSFAFFGGDGDVCDGLGAVCADSNCKTAFFQPNDNSVQRSCQANNVNLLITFCDGVKTSEFTEAVVGSMSGGNVRGDSGIASSSSKAEPSSSPTNAAPYSSTSEASSTSVPAQEQSNTAVNSSPADNSSADTSIPVHTASVSGSGLTSGSGSTVSTATKASPTCKRSRSRRSKRAATLSNHARSQSRARALAGVHGSSTF
ncbi:uncharacterized protein FOMMEDRAFT_146612 [Fomitiporia mediterranea MF3/22]|uniref:uncharacterized protein n=1 Tax=Fomitiporia mediterranea (strain MF3/22) TaxID=694068 RepID=UPI000440770E|nr:uncharacterized protein FOMMEDRAFT_146612 [Fomitiporia mediterranea MF3/22]EJD02778.1 hypothetical protein FOMMEDRAFT_146612 [Fomitiporia mediterranea MF3/22]